MTDPTPRPNGSSSTEIDEDDTEGHAASWKLVVDPRAGTRTLRQEWTPDEPRDAGSAGRVTAPRKPQAR